MRILISHEWLLISHEWLLCVAPPSVTIETWLVGDKDLYCERCRSLFLTNDSLSLTSHSYSCLPRVWLVRDDSWEIRIFTARQADPYFSRMTPHLSRITPMRRSPACDSWRIRHPTCLRHPVQGGEDANDAWSCRSFSAKEPLCIWLFCRKWRIKKGIPRVVATL